MERFPICETEFVVYRILGRSAGSFLEQRLVIEPTKRHILLFPSYLLIRLWFPNKFECMLSLSFQGLRRLQIKRARVPRTLFNPKE